MSKLSTKDIKNLIPTWLGTDELKEILREYYVQDDSGPQSVARYGEWFGVKPPNTHEQVRDAIWAQWISGAEWKREEKHRVGESWEDFIFADHETKEPEFSEDFTGGSDKELVKKYYNDPAQAEKCWYRLFVPKGNLGDNFRLEVITTPEDDKIVGWIVTVD